MDIRTWVYQRLSTTEPLNVLVPADRVVQARAVEVAPKTPFILYALEPEVASPIPGVRWAGCTVWAHDEPGSYLRVDTIIEEAERAFLSHYSAGDFITAVSNGWSTDLFDDALGTITRNVSLRLAIRRPVV